MPTLTLDEAKVVLQVEHDHIDIMIQDYTDAVDAWIGRVTGQVFDPAPPDVRQAARMLLAHWFDQRSAASDRVQVPVPFGVRALLANHRSFVHGPAPEVQEPVSETPA